VYGFHERNRQTCADRVPAVKSSGRLGACCRIDQTKGQLKGLASYEVGKILWWVLANFFFWVPPPPPGGAKKKK
jgi:hypothetical protein